MVLTYIKETHRVHGTTSLLVLCPKCFAEMPDFMKTSHGRNANGYALDVHPWTGKADQECSHCPAKHSDPVVNALGVVVLLLAVLLLPTQAHAQTAPIVIGNVADAISTEVALARGPRFAEANPVMGPHVAQRLAVKTLGTALEVWMVRKLEPQHPTMAKVLGYSIGAGLSAIAVRNARMGR